MPAAGDGSSAAPWDQAFARAIVGHMMKLFGVGRLHLPAVERLGQAFAGGGIISAPLTVRPDFGAFARGGVIHCGADFGAVPAVLTSEYVVRKR